jgi:hypothetical protein
MLKGRPEIPSSVLNGMVPPWSEKKIAWSVPGELCQMLTQLFCVVKRGSVRRDEGRQLFHCIFSDRRWRVLPASRLRTALGRGINLVCACQSKDWEKMSSTGDLTRRLGSSWARHSGSRYSGSPHGSWSPMLQLRAFRSGTNPKPFLSRARPLRVLRPSHSGISFQRSWVTPRTCGANNSD